MTELSRRTNTEAEGNEAQDRGSANTEGPIVCNVFENLQQIKITTFIERPVPALCRLKELVSELV